MTGARVRILACLFCLLFALPAGAQELANSAEPAHALFGEKRVPSASAPSAFGKYAGGCLAGGVRLPEWGGAWQAMKPARNRNWGHPDMIQFIQRLAEQAQYAGWPGLFVGDIGQPRGGPMKSGHRSHQIGLDVDVWLRRPTEWREFSTRERDAMGSVVVVAPDGINLNEHWTPSHLEVIKAAAQDPAVARIFVNAAIKRWMCQHETGPDGRVEAPWLRKIRPWKGHNAHFHVRLHCPIGSPHCRNQGAPPPGPGCGAELSKWFPKGGTVKDETVSAPSEEEEEGSKFKWAGKEGADGEGATRALGGATRGIRGDLTMADLPSFCRAVLADNAAALAQIDAYATPEAVTPKLPVFFETSAEAHEGFVGTRYFWRPKVDLTAARSRNVQLEVVGDLPPGLEFVDRGAGSALLSGTPTTGGEYAFTLVARHRGREDGSQTVSLTVIDLGHGDVPPKPSEDPTEPDPMAKSLEYQVKDFLVEFTGDECFLAVPYEIAEADIKIETFADDVSPIYEFDAAFMKAIGIEARVGGRLIRQAQCPALAFVRSYPYGNPAPIDSDDPDRTVDVGEVITVSVAVARVRRLTLMLIGPDGSVVDLTDYMQRQGNRLAVSLRAASSGPQVLVAIDTAIPIPPEHRQEAQRKGDIFALIQGGQDNRDLDPRASVALVVVR